jgi:hypothetical protein
MSENAHFLIKPVRPALAGDEYLRRNLMHAKSCGLFAQILVTTDRVAKLKRPPKWLIHHLTEMRKRAEPLMPEMAAWRDSSTDNPYAQPNRQAEGRVSDATATAENGGQP